jgi:hypothetical protein
MNDLAEMTIGVLILENNPYGDLYGTEKLTVKGSLGNPATFNYPVIYETVPGATGDRVVYDGKSMTDAYISAAAKLAARGAGVITTNCGFTILLQKDLADVIAVPVVTSSLVLLPLISNLISRRGEIGILTYDSESLQKNILGSGKVAIPENRLAVRGFHQYPSWSELNQPTPEVDAGQMKTDLLAGCHEILAKNPNIEALLLECTGMPRFRSDVQRIAKRPVFDIVDAVHFVAASLR